MDATTLAVDLAKAIFEVALANRAGREWTTRPQPEFFSSGLKRPEPLPIPERQRR